MDYLWIYLLVTCGSVKKCTCRAALVRQFYAPRDGVSNPASVGSHWSDIIGLSLRGGRGEDSAGDDLDCRIPSTSGNQSSPCGLKKTYVSQGLSDPTKDGVYAGCKARGNVGVIDYQIGIKRETIKKTIKKKIHWLSYRVIHSIDWMNEVHDHMRISILSIWLQAIAPQTGQSMLF